MLRVLRMSLATALLLTFLSAIAIAGKPPNNPPTPPPTPVKFALQRLSMPSDYASVGGGLVTVQQINQFGEGVGYYELSGGVRQPFAFNVGSGAAVVTNLNDLTFDPEYDIPAEWYLFRAHGINNSGDIVGAMALWTDPSVRRGFVLELRPDPFDAAVPPRLHVIPDGGWNNTYARHINDAGEVLVRGDSVTAYLYRPALHGMPGDMEMPAPIPTPFDAFYAVMNNATSQHDTQFMGWSDSLGSYFRYTMGDASYELIDLNIGDIRGLNNSGAFCGHRYSGKNKTYGFYYDGAMHDFPAIGFAQYITAENDILGEGGGKPLTLVHSALGSLDLKSLTVATNPAEQSLWNNSSTNWSTMSERSVAGTNPAVANVPVVAGALKRSDLGSFYYDAYVLLPIPPN